VPDLLSILQSPRRREILRLCWREAVPAGRIREALPDVTFGAVSQHLAVLRAANLVDVEPRGRERLYRARRDALGPFRRWLETAWDDALYRLQLAAELEASRRGPSPGGGARPRDRTRPTRTRTRTRTRPDTRTGKPRARAPAGAKKAASPTDGPDRRRPRP
jgi:DNA-binding transcriptional ArsR family regulator